MNERHEQMIERLAKWIEVRGLRSPAILLLEANKPLAVIGGQTLLFLQPLLGWVGPALGWSVGREPAAEWAALLEGPAASIAFSTGWNRAGIMFQLQVEPITIAVWAILAGVPLLLWRFTLYVRRRARDPLREIAAFDVLRGLMGRTAEQGKRVHLSLGRSGIGAEQTPTVSAGLNVLRAMADEGAALGDAPIVTVADPIVLLAAQDVVYRAHQRLGNTDKAIETDVQLIAPDPTAYVVGAQQVVNNEGTGANVMVGHLDDEYLLLGEPGARRQIVQVAGSDALSAQPFVLATSDRALLGEELYAAGAYLSREPAQVASLYVQDVLRGLAVVAIVIGILLKTFT